MVMLFHGSRGADWTAYIAGAKHALDTATGGRNYNFGRKGSIKAVEPVWKILLPYCLHPMIGEPDKWIWLNREYKPLGTFTNDYNFHYESFTQHHVRKDDPRIVDFLKLCLPVRHDAVWVYCDLTAPNKSLRNARAFADKLETIDLSNPALDALGEERT